MAERNIEMPPEAGVTISGMKVKVSGPKGELTKSFDDPRLNKMIVMEKSDNSVVVKTSSEKRKMKAVVGTIAKHIKNMALGVTTGYKYTMKILYTHFPINITVKDKEVQIRNFFGEKGARVAKVVGKVDVKIDKDEITLTGINIEDVGQTAANIEQACRLSGRDRRIFQDGIYITGRFLQSGEKIV